MKNAADKPGMAVRFEVTNKARRGSYYKRDLHMPMKQRIQDYSLF